MHLTFKLLCCFFLFSCMLNTNLQIGLFFIQIIINYCITGLEIKKVCKVDLFIEKNYNHLNIMILYQLDLFTNTLDVYTDTCWKI